MKIKVILFFLFLTGLSLQGFAAGDTVRVQTFTFDTIQTRKAYYDFPGNPRDFRKILMRYTLKCDPRTVHDKYNCGEWDYLTYTILHLPTGVMDSTRREYPLYTLGADKGDTLRASSRRSYDIYKYSRNYVSAFSINSEKKHDFGSDDFLLPGSSDKGRFQVYITRAKLKELGINDEIKKIRLKFQTPGIKLNNFMVRMANTLIKKSDKIINDKFDTLFYADVTTKEELDLYFVKAFKAKSLYNVLLDISYEAESQAPVFQAWNDTNVTASGNDKYLYFDGKNDFVQLGKFNELNSKNQVTYELWLRMDEWEANTIIGKGDKIALATGTDPGTIMCIVRDKNTNYGSAQSMLNVGEWTHIAMVFDGAKEKLEDRLILYVNGIKRGMNFRGNIPRETYPTSLPLELASLSTNASSFKGAMNEVRIWNQVLSEGEVKNWMYKTISGAHPAINRLLGYFPISDEAPHSLKNLAGIENGILIGEPVLKDISAPELNNASLSLLTPAFSLFEGDYSTTLTAENWQDSLESKTVSLVKWKIENRIPVIDEIDYYYAGGWHYTYAPNGSKTDSTFTNYDMEAINSKLVYYEEPYEVKKELEIGRFITPYGINLDLGPEGFTWLYDVSDYAPYLKGKVEFSAGNLQELIDVEFLFIKGTPPREVIDVIDVWKPLGSFSYKSLSDNASFPEVTIPLLPEAEQFKLKTRITGHGHNSNDGSYPHCCEWKVNDHYININGTPTFDWKIYRYDCAWNPVYPQGGTWPGAREGWCPGDIVPDHDYELGPIIGKNADKVSVDYRITPVPDNNQGMGNGNYVMALQLVEYKGANYNTDAEIYDITAPNKFPLYSRMNPICAPPVVLVRNNGTAKISSIEIEYGVKGGMKLTQNIDVEIAANETKNIELNVPESKFWMGDGSNVFEAKITKVDGAKDQYEENDAAQTEFTMPDAYAEAPIFQLKTNLRPEDFIYQIKDLSGKVIFERKFMSANTLYSDTLRFAPGCYTLELIDKNQLGLSYWAVPDQGSGYFRINDASGKLLKNFNPDFGAGAVYSFNLGNWTYVKEDNIINILEAYPNPAKDHINVSLNKNLGTSKVEIYNEAGVQVNSIKADIKEDYKLKLDISKLSSGSYVIVIKSKERSFTRKFVKS